MGIATGPGRPPRHHEAGVPTMNDWMTTVEAVSNLLNLAAAVITLIAIRSQHNDK